MTKYVPKKLTQLSANESAAVDIINQNFDSIKEHIDDALSRTAKAPSQMQAPLDMNGQKILNLGTPTQDTDVVRRKDVIEDKEEIKQLVSTASIAVEKAMEAAETAEEAAEDMADQIQLAKDWATKTSGPVADNEYSSKYYAEQIGADVHTVADIAEDVTTVADNTTNINTVASDISNINAVAGDLTNIDAVVSNETNVNAVATNISDINDCADNIVAIQGAPAAAESAAASAEQAAQSAAISNPPPLLSYQWTDHLLNDIRYLRADTFSWQSGLVYTAAYNHLVNDIDGKTQQTETIGSYTISYYLADDGHKITTDETNVANIYNESGVAWYYVLDTTNQRFKLPRTKYGFVGLRDSVGKYVPETLPNIKGSFGSESGTWRVNTVTETGAFTVETTNNSATGGSSNGIKTVTFNANASSATYQDSAPVQQRATQMYLYFYVGNYNKTAIEQTAGLNTELFNGKVDLNAANLSTQGKSLISGLSMPSSRYENLTLGASGSTYTAPANGLFYLWKNAGTPGFNPFICLTNATAGFATEHRPGGSGDGLAIRLYIPAKKGDVVAIDYDATGTVFVFKFIYAEGEV